MKKRKINKFFILLLLFLGSLFFLFIRNKDSFSIKVKNEYYIKNNTNLVSTYNENFEIIGELPRGIKVKENGKVDNNKENKYKKIKYKDRSYILLTDNLTKNKNKIILEKNIYVKTPVSVYEKNNELKVIGMAKQGEELTVLGYDTIDEKGKVNKYKIKYGENIGYVYGKYIEYNKEIAILPYKNYNELHSKSGSYLGGGAAQNLDYYPVNKPKFKDNIMPEKVYALYLNSGKNVIQNIDKYLEIAKETKLNAFVVDIKDNQSPGYKSPVMEKYSPTNYKYANNTYEEYKNCIKKIKDAGYYVIGRITVFKDKYYATDNPSSAITNTISKEPFLHAGTYWPSPFSRDVWEFNVALAIEGVKELGFNEINFDYIRFPDRTLSYEKDNLMDFKNIYSEEKVQAIQRFLMYATDEIHNVGGYVSGDVFGESAHKYVTAYGQYYSAMSNVLDVISPMPYPDHFSDYEYGFKTPVYTIPYELLDYWGKNYVIWHQQNVPTPAISRSWIQTYNSYKGGGYTYGVEQVDAQIRALYNNGLNGGYMTWNSGSSLDKYSALKEVWNKEY